ncbi:hypothetical protein Fmac_010709 [Flemingia macrophylla]|uniref:UBA domain-containing protein n=1 Tax=Flemingia macrophylla TaxID=520843 RepID=A0ABD1MKE2_9FABA
MEGLKPLRERTRSWDDEVCVGTWTWKFLDTTNGSSRFPDIRKTNGNSVIELVSTPTKISGVHYVQDIEKNISDSENDDTLRTLVKMGYKQEEALIAIERLAQVFVTQLKCILDEHFILHSSGSMQLKLGVKTYVWTLSSEPSTFEDSLHLAHMNMFRESWDA